MTALIRDAADADMAAIRAIYAHHVLHGLGTFEERTPELPDMVVRRRESLALGLPWLVAETGGGVAGYAYAAPYRQRSAYRFAIEDSVYVAEGLGRRGVGLALLSALIERCEVGPWRRMLAVIGDSGNAGSIGLHRRLGFDHAGMLRSVGFKFGRWVDVVIMQRALGAGDATAPRDREA